MCCLFFPQLFFPQLSQADGLVQTKKRPSRQNLILVTWDGPQASPRHGIMGWATSTQVTCLVVDAGMPWLSRRLRRLRAPIGLSRYGAIELSSTSGPSKPVHISRFTLHGSRQPVTAGFLSVIGHISHATMLCVVHLDNIYVSHVSYSLRILKVKLQFSLLASLTHRQPDATPYSRSSCHSHSHSQSHSHSHSHSQFRSRSHYRHSRHW
jgi:hypothetical protein